MSSGSRGSNASYDLAAALGAERRALLCTLAASLASVCDLGRRCAVALKAGNELFKEVKSNEGAYRKNEGEEKSKCRTNTHRIGFTEEFLRLGICDANDDNGNEKKNVQSRISKVGDIAHSLELYGAKGSGNSNAEEFLDNNNCGAISIAIAAMRMKSFYVKQILSFS